jgi:cobalt/nickel transport system permease protein
MSDPSYVATPTRSSVATATPEWLLRGEVALCPCGCIGKRKRGSFVEKTLTAGSDLLRQVMFSEDVALQGGLLQRVDARAKIVAMLVLLVAASFLHTIAVLLALYALTLLAAVASRLPVGYFIKRVWLFIPVFTLVVILPATLSIVTPGHIVLELWSWHGHPEGFTAQGLTSAGLVVSRVAVSISVVLLLTLTTPWVKLLAALRSLGVPRMFVMVISMAYRYIFLLLGSVSEMYESRAARTVGAVRHDKAARAFVGASAGALIGKANHLSEEVHQAMVSRGYRGEATTVQTFRLRATDVVFTAAACLCGATAWWGDRILGH